MLRRTISYRKKKCSLLSLAVKIIPMHLSFDKELRAEYKMGEPGWWNW